MKNRGMPPLHLAAARKNKRGVSPIIATILLVAITVVIAAVLYVLVSGYLGHSTASPITIGWGSTSFNENAAKTHFYYNTTVESVSPSNLHWNDIVSVSVKTSSNGPYAGTVNAITVFGANGGSAVFSAGSWTFSGGMSSSTTISAGDTLVVDLSSADAGGTVVLAPSSSFSGTSAINLP